MKFGGWSSQSAERDPCIQLRRVRNAFLPTANVTSRNPRRPPHCERLGISTRETFGTYCTYRTYTLT